MDLFQLNGDVAFVTGAGRDGGRCLPTADQSAARFNHAGASQHARTTFGGAIHRSRACAGKGEALNGISAQWRARLSRGGDARSDNQHFSI